MNKNYMKAKGIMSDTNHAANLIVKDNTEDGDVISSFPDEILWQITARLPIESAVQTSFLSTRWRHIWNVSLVQHGNIQGLAAATSSFVSNFDELDPSRNVRRLQFHCYEGNSLLATIAPNNKLNLDFSNTKQQFSTPFDLKLMPNCQSLSTFFVKTLSLSSLCHLTAEAVSTIVSNFQLLENLKITDCKGLQSFHINSSTKLQKLTILDCMQLESIRIHSFKLRSFQYRGLLPWICPEVHFNLSDAMLDCRQGPSNNGFTSQKFDALLLTIKNAEILTLCKWTFEELISPSISPLSSAFQFYRLKELRWIQKSMEDYSNDALLSFLKLCPALERLFVTIDSTSYSMGSANKYQKQGAKNAQKGHLKLLKLEGFTNEESEISLAEQLSERLNKDTQIISAKETYVVRNQLFY